MSQNDLNGKRVAILATDGVERAELTEPRKALDEAGAKTVLVSPKEGSIKSWERDHWGEKLDVDLDLADANASDFDALMLPGGVMNPDHLRQDERAVAFAKAFADAGKPIAAICHGPWLLVEADVVRGRTVTSWPSLKTDLLNAGADWVDREVATDMGLVTSRKPDDIPAFNKKMIEEIREGVHDRARPAARTADTARDSSNELRR
ncbi:MAG TPA: type 1 glutamine amidotransferase domain-containing protein [Gemmatimonadaceae bacterium]|jgi:protease I|nr:type 1 glutamine amidotransferase domain-containing protein [Gemmatimonadaceae bacterium]